MWNLPPLDLAGDVIADLDELGIGHLSGFGQIRQDLLGSFLISRLKRMFSLVVSQGMKEGS